jgi:hypothetical protein
MILFCQHKCKEHVNLLVLQEWQINIREIILRILKKKAQPHNNGE